MLLNIQILVFPYTKSTICKLEADIDALAWKYINLTHSLLRKTQLLLFPVFQDSKDLSDCLCFE